jgi:uncharacterized protein with HEPN domain
MREADRIRLPHMRDAAREALSFIQGLTKAELKRNRMLALSLVKELEIIGEAATNVSAELQASTAEIPWAVIVGMRNRLIHAYFEVDFDIVWITTTSKLPDLANQLDRLLADTD